jgi:hypothetical protein
VADRTRDAGHNRVTHKRMAAAHNRVAADQGTGRSRVVTDERTAVADNLVAADRTRDVGHSRVTHKRMAAAYTRVVAERGMGHSQVAAYKRTAVTHSRVEG